MAIINLNATIKLRIDTSQNWEAVNPILENGEIIIVVKPDGKRDVKIGDGVKAYTSLPFSFASSEAILEMQSQIVEINQILEAAGLKGGTTITIDEYQELYSVNATNPNMIYHIIERK